jgi:hypothetical protein
VSPAFLLALLAVAVSVVAVIIATRSSGPRVTHIDTRRNENHGDDR